jgi:hypothetical protein
MEPTDMTPSSGDDRLEVLLRQERSAPLADSGFSARVLAALPPQQNPWLVGVRISLLTTAALAGLVVALWQDGGATDLAAQSEKLIAIASDQLADPWLLVALLATAGSLALATLDDSMETHLD